jgi:hypothetical protein
MGAVAAARTQNPTRLVRSAISAKAYALVAQYGLRGGDGTMWTRILSTTGA